MWLRATLPRFLYGPLIPTLCGARRAALMRAWRAVSVGLLLAALALMAYWPSMAGPFAYDSVSAIKLNPDFRFDDHALDEWYAAGLSGAAGPSLRPVAMLGFALNAAISGTDAPLAFRLCNLLLHMTNAFLVFLALRALCRCFGSTGGRDKIPVTRHTAISGLAAAIFLLHPIQLTAVVHDVQRMALLATLFQLLALLVFLRGRPGWSASGPGRVRACNDLTWIALLTTLGFFSKENALLTLLLLLVVEAFCFASRPVRILVAAFALPLAAVGGWMLGGGASVLDAMYAGRDFDLVDRLLTQARVLWMYLYWFFQPAALTAGMHHDDIVISRSMADPWVLAALLAWLLVCGLLVRGALRRRGLGLPAFAFAWFLVLHLMESTVVPLEIAFEHRNYGAVTGFAMLVAVFVFRVVDALPRSLASALPVFVLAPLWVLLFMRASAWESPLTLAVFSVAERPDSPRSRADLAEAQFNLALQRNDREQAVASRDAFDQVAAAQPDSLLPLARLIEIDAILGDDARLAGHAERFASVLRKPTLTIQDTIGLNLLLDCSARARCLDAAGTAHILDALSRRQDLRPADVALRRARLILAQTSDPIAALQTIESGPPLKSYTAREITEVAVLQGIAGQPAAALESIRMAMTLDPSRRLSAVLRRLYSDPQPDRAG